MKFSPVRFWLSRWLLRFSWNVACVAAMLVILASVFCLIVNTLYPSHSVLHFDSAAGHDTIDTTLADSLQRQQIDTVHGMTRNTLDKSDAKGDTRYDTNPISDALSAVTALIAVVGLLLAIGTLLLQYRLRDMDRAIEKANEAETTIDVMSRIALSRLPDLSITQHISRPAMLLLAELRNLYRNSVAFRDQLEANSKIQLALGVFYYGKGDSHVRDAIHWLTKARENGSSNGDIEVNLLAQYRLGIAYRQLGDMERSIAEFDNLMNQGSSHYKNLASQGKALSYYRIFKEDMDFQSSVWAGETSCGKLKDQLKDPRPLITAYKLMSEPDEGNFTSFYRCQMLADIYMYGQHDLADIDEEECRLEIEKQAMECIDFLGNPSRKLLRSLLNGGDISVAANQCIALYICHSFLHDVGSKDHKGYHRSFMKDSIDLAKDLVKSLRSDYPDTVIYSESRLKELDAEGYIGIDLKPLE